MLAPTDNHKVTCRARPQHLAPIPPELTVADAARVLLVLAMCARWCKAGKYRRFHGFKSGYPFRHYKLPTNPPSSFSGAQCRMLPQMLPFSAAITRWTFCGKS